MKFLSMMFHQNPTKRIKHFDNKIIDIGTLNALLENPSGIVQPRVNRFNLQQSIDYITFMVKPTTGMQEFNGCAFVLHPDIEETQLILTYVASIERFIEKEITARYAQNTEIRTKVQYTIAHFGNSLYTPIASKSTCWNFDGDKRKYTRAITNLYELTYTNGYSSVQQRSSIVTNITTSVPQVFGFPKLCLEVQYIPLHSNSYSVIGARVPIFSIFFVLLNLNTTLYEYMNVTNMHHMLPMHVQFGDRSYITFIPEFNNYEKYAEWLEQYKNNLSIYEEYANKLLSAFVLDLEILLKHLGAKGVELLPFISNHNFHIDFIGNSIPRNKSSIPYGLLFARNHRFVNGALNNLKNDMSIVKHIVTLQANKS